MKKNKLFSLLFLSIGLALVFSSYIPPECPDENGEFATLIPHEEDCTKFWKCDRGLAIEKDCPAGLGFDPVFSVCTYPEEIAGCDVGISGGDKGSIDANYTRQTSNCVIYGDGKIKLVGGTVLEVKGKLILENYQVTCFSGGNASCKPVECAEIWGWL